MSPFYRRAPGEAPRGQGTCSSLQQQSSEHPEPRLPDSRVHAFNHTAVLAILQAGEILLYPPPFRDANGPQTGDPLALVCRAPLHSERGEVREGGVTKKGFLEEVDLRGSGQGHSR